MYTQQPYTQVVYGTPGQPQPGVMYGGQQPVYTATDGSAPQMNAGNGLAPDMVYVDPRYQGIHQHPGYRGRWNDRSTGKKILGIVVIIIFLSTIGGMAYLIYSMVTADDTPSVTIHEEP